MLLYLMFQAFKLINVYVISLNILLKILFDFVDS
jgi:hypothetical protein